MGETHPGRCLFPDGVFTAGRRAGRASPTGIPRVAAHRVQRVGGEPAPRGHRFLATGAGGLAAQHDARVCRMKRRGRRRERVPAAGGRGVVRGITTQRRRGRRERVAAQRRRERRRMVAQRVAARRPQHDRVATPHADRRYGGRDGIASGHCGRGGHGRGHATPVVLVHVFGLAASGTAVDVAIGGHGEVHLLDRSPFGLGGLVGEFYVLEQGFEPLERGRGGRHVDGGTTRVTL